MLPVPDPKDMTEKISTWSGSAMSAITTKTGGSGKKKGADSSEYSQNFGAPGTLNLSDDDDDEEDLGKDKGGIDRENEFASDEENDTSNANTELISLDSGSSTKKRKKVPKLQKPDTK